MIILIYIQIFFIGLVNFIKKSKVKGSRVNCAPIVNCSLDYLYFLKQIMQKV